MKYLLLIPFLIVSLISDVHAQIPTGAPGDLNGYRQKTSTNLKAKGSPYIQDKFELANIKGFEGSYLTRYNAWTEEMEIKVKGSIKIVPIEYVSEIVFLGNNEIYQSVALEKNKLIYALANWSDKNGNALYTKQRVLFKEAKKAANSLTQDLPAKYDRTKDRYFIKYSNGSIVELPSRKKMFFNSFKGKEKEIKTFVKKNRLEINNANDVKKIVAFYFN